MKRILFISVLAVLFLGCSKEDEPEVSSPSEETEQAEAFSLSGKTYAAYGGQGGIYGFEVYDVYYVSRFTSNNNVEQTARKNSPTGEILGAIVNYTYTIDYPTLTITMGSNEVIATFVDEETYRTGSGSNVTEYILQ
ncbi:hypothetical protein [Sunxiuqinia elliptica]|uniref:Lipoprotein n=1 Tax=Sunxiuqinia elliptica TaxID=655355 RepID=A0A1I2A2S9_9BACT|nr:hypothetical protein [Sunxiuqinia elliptica]SFE38251.1 hypothetical protein SAMN05216283_1016 [Sunxiuqinia elliptica]